MSISSPAKNISRSLPMSEKNAATGGFLGATPRPDGPKPTPAASNPTADGSRIRSQNRGTKSRSASASAKRVSVGSSVSAFRNSSITSTTRPRGCPPMLARRGDASTPLERRRAGTLVSSATDLEVAGQHVLARALVPHLVVRESDRVLGTILEARGGIGQPEREPPCPGLGVRRHDDPGFELRLGVGPPATRIGASPLGGEDVTGRAVAQHDEDRTGVERRREAAVPQAQRQRHLVPGTDRARPFPLDEREPVAQPP